MESTSTSILIEEEVQHIMANIDESSVNEETKEVCKFYLEGRCRFGEDCINRHEGEPLIQKKKKKISKPVEKSEKDSLKKKRSMKTATDVIKRLQWDKSLDDNLFTIGYMDRFLGVLEKPFCDFSWENLASVDDTEVFAIPRHRIQYFKYKGEKVWDKASRLDLIFGSTGDTRGIHSIINEIDELKINEDLSDYTSDSDDYSDSDDENDAKVYICDPRSKINELAIQEEDRSTHFIAIHVKEPKILEGIKEVQNSIRSEEELLSDCCMDAGLIHVTLEMLRLDGPEGIQECIDLIQSVKESVNQLPKIELNLEGIGTFGQRVLYAKVHPDNPLNFDQLRSIILSAVLQKSSHIKSTNKFEYVPHVTMTKVSRPISRLRRSKYIPGSYYSQFIDKNFGKFVVDNVKLCVIDDDRGPDGFYQTISTITF